IDMLYKGINHPNYKIHIRLCKIFILEIDMLYKGINHPNYKIHIRLCKIFILEGPYAGNFISKYASDGKMNAVLALEALEKFFQGAGAPIVGDYDHVVLFTGFDLFKYESSGKKNYAYV
uniref:Uncharacterized protein n=1 Tax=Biomphalaria glabrata TaxID=6526 RepID=A0A2C9KSD2_BIOGL